MSSEKSGECCELMHIHEDAVKIVNDNMPLDEQIYDLSDFFKIFGDSTRLKILFVLSEAEVCVCDIAAILGMSQSAISHQLRVLKSNKLVRFRREGKTIFYSLADSHIKTILSQGLEHIEE